MADFRALLTSFQSATGEAATSTVPSSQEENKPKSLKELTTSLWHRTQLKQGVNSLRKEDRTEGIDQDEKTRLAICLCVVDSLTHEDIWKDWIGVKSDAKVSAKLYVHAKSPESVRTNWAKSKLIGLTHRPNWNDVRIVKAMLSLIKEALKDDKTTHVLFGTESCLPICPLSEVNIVRGKSYVAYYGKRHATRFDERDIWDVLRQCMPLDAIHKALPGWCTLAREHAQQIIDMPAAHLDGKNLWEAFEPCWAPEEAFFPTALALLGLLPETICRSLTYAEWNERTRRPEDKAHPMSWDHAFNAELVSVLRRDHNCIVLRKVKHPVSLSRWKHAVTDASKRPIQPIDSPSVSNKKPRIDGQSDQTC